MTDDLFTVDTTPATPLAKASARLAKAIAEIDRIEAAIDLIHDANRELRLARNSVEVEENRELERLKQQTK